MKMMWFTLLRVPAAVPPGAAGGAGAGAIPATIPWQPLRSRRKNKVGEQTSKVRARKALFKKVIRLIWQRNF
jgi:hypothetical protein